MVVVSLGRHFGIHNSQSSSAQTSQMRPRIHGVRLSVAYSTPSSGDSSRAGLAVRLRRAALVQSSC